MARLVPIRCSLKDGGESRRDATHAPNGSHRAVATGPTPQGQKPLADLPSITSGMFLPVILPLACCDLPVPPHRAFMVLLGAGALPATL